MIPRYTRPQMAAIWDPQTRYRIWFEIEAHAADAMAELGVIPKAASRELWAKGKDAKLAYAYAEFFRAKERLICARTEVATCAISGAVGTFAQVDPRVEEHVAKAMGLAVEPVSTQIIPRDRHAMYFATLGVVASSVERLATEVRHLQRTEGLKAEEFFTAGQKGSP